MTHSKLDKIAVALLLFLSIVCLILVAYARIQHGAAIVSSEMLQTALLFQILAGVIRVNKNN